MTQEGETDVVCVCVWGVTWDSVPGRAVCKGVFGEKERMRTGGETGIDAMEYSPATARSLLVMGVPGNESPRL